jgi:FkbH-like protein
MLANKVKLVIWDLDDTFWQGTLTEGGIVPVERNREIVLELSRRGILNSICSKNDYEQVKATLGDLGIWDYFVFPHIQFSPKGRAVAEMLESAGLRVENTLFIDDNPSNLEEVKFFNPGIMTARAADILDALLDHPHCAGKPDPELTRLKQYQFLQRKVVERGASALSNEEFLRASNIRVRIDYNVDANLDRVLELINRTNQLNYTKSRVENAEAIWQFWMELKGSRNNSGCVWVSDNYGDYGLAGFFMMTVRAAVKRLSHFVFSCRAMNMGVEQYVYEMLGEPEIDIAPPVSYGLKPHACVDWINTGNPDADGAMGVGNRKLVLLGACELLQLASYCSSSRVEFVNDSKEDVKVVYTDPGFILNDRDVMRDAETLRRIPSWTYEEAVRLDEALASAELVLLSLPAAMQGRYFKTRDGLRLRLASRMQRLIRERDPVWFENNFEHLPLDESGKLALVAEALDSIGAKTPDRCRVFVLSCNMHVRTQHERNERRLRFNQVCRSHCEQQPNKFRYIEIAEHVSAKELVGKSHFSRQGYYGLARHILSLADEACTPVQAAPEELVLSAA